MGERLVSVTFDGGKRLTMAGLKKLGKGVLNLGKYGYNKFSSNKERITKLDKNGEQLAGMPVSTSEIRGLDKLMKRYDLEYSLIRAKNDPSKYTFFFKAKDFDRMGFAMQDLIADKTLDNDGLYERLEKARDSALKINEVKKLERQQTKTMSKGKGKAKEVSR